MVYRSVREVYRGRYVVKNRVYQIDFIKVFAVFSVVSIHFLLNSGFYDLTINTWISGLYVILRTLFITCVPLFIMTTGFLMGNKTFSDKYISKIGRVLTVYVVVSLIDWAIQSLWLGNKGGLRDAFYGLFDFSTNSYAWYVEMYIGLYLLIPILNAAWHAGIEKKYHLYIVSVSIVLFFLPSMFNIFGKIIPDWWIGAYPIGYYYIGMYVKTYGESIQNMSLKRLLPVSMFLVSMIGIIELNNNWGKVFNWTVENDYMGYQALIISIIIFVLFMRIPVTNQAAKKYRFWPVMSGMVLTVYLYSDLTDSIIYHYFNQLIPVAEDRLVWGPLVVVCSFVSASILAFITERVISKYNFVSKGKET